MSHKNNKPPHSLNLSLGLPDQGEQEQGNSSLYNSQDQEALSRHQLYTSGSINAEQPFGTFGNNHLLPSTHVNQWRHAYPFPQPIPVGRQDQGEQERGNSLLSGKAPKRGRPRKAPVLHDESQPRGPRPRSDNATSGSVNAEQPFGSFGNKHLLPSIHVNQWHHAYPVPQQIPVSQQVQQGHMPPHFSPSSSTPARFSPRPGYNRPGLSDPQNSWRAQAQQLYPPNAYYTTPRGYPSSHIPTFPNPSESLAQWSQREHIKRHPKPSQKQQRPLEDLSVQNSWLLKLVSQLQSELVEVKRRSGKLEAQVLSLKHAMGKDSLPAVNTDAPVLHDESQPRGPGPTLTMTEEAQARGTAAVSKKVTSDVDQGESSIEANMPEMRTSEAGLHSGIPKYDDESEFLRNACESFLLDPPSAFAMEELLGSSAGEKNKGIEEQSTTVHEDNAEETTLPKCSFNKQEDA